MCGVFGVFNARKAAEITYLGLHAIQHRAQAYAGIISSDGNNLYRRVGPGIVQDVFEQKDLDKLHGNTAVGHIRYPTVKDDPQRDNAQPIIYKETAIVHNGNIANQDLIREELEKTYGPLKTSMDSELILRLFCNSKERALFKKVFDAVKDLRGSYSMIILFNDTMIIVRDPTGNRPLSIARRNGSLFVSSETTSFDHLDDITEVRDVLPGEIIIVTKDKEESWFFNQSKISKTPLLEEQQSHIARCIFEWLYFAHPTSHLFEGESVAKFRIRAGCQLCKHCPSPGKVVIPVPDSANFHAQGFADADPKAKLKRAITRSHYIARTFIEMTQLIRAAKVAKKFSVVKDMVDGKVITLIDDSIVRLTTMPEVIKMLKKAGALEVHVRITTPPILWSCHYGIDTPTSEELIANSHTLEQITEMSGADSLEYMPLQALKELVEDPENYCFACMDGIYPI